MIDCDDIYWGETISDDQIDCSNRQYKNNFFVEIRTPRSITCKHCGEKNLRFDKIKDKWILRSNSDGNVHKCSKRPMPEEALEELKKHALQNIKKKCKGKLQSTE